MNATSDDVDDRLPATEAVPPGFGITDPDGRVLGDIQGNILRGYNMRYVRHIVVRVADARAAQAFIGLVVSGDAADSLTTAAQWERESKPKTCLNIGITAEGLVALGLDDRSMRTFPEEFRQGPAKRAKKIGDVDGSAPENWRFGLADSDNVHVLWTIHADSRADLESATERIESTWKQTGAYTVMSHIDGATFDTYDEQHRDARAMVHFGYRDSISQPRFAVNDVRIGTPDAQPLAPIGTVLIGPEYTTTFPDVLWQIPRAYRESVEFPIATNGCYNAFRVLEQDVYGFEEFLEQSAAAINIELERRRTTSGVTAAPAGQAPTEEWQIIWDKERVAAKLLGRWRNGVPMHQSDGTLGPFLGSGMPPLLPDAALNDFDYPDPDPRLHDFDGRQCPMGAHIRRANPRSAQIVQRSANHTRLVVRRGIPYGPPFDPATADDHVPRGLLGNFLCASLIAQFEAIMYDWVNLGLQDPRITGTNDPIIGANQVRTSRFEIPTTIGDSFGEPLVLRGFPRFTVTVGSAYLFCPSITSLRFLADPYGPVPQRPASANSARLVTSGVKPTVAAGAPSGRAPRVARRRWRRRRSFWNHVAILKFKGQKPAVIPTPTPTDAIVTLVPFTKKYPDIPIAGIVVADRIPPDDLDKAKEIFTRVQHRVVRRYSPMQADLPPVPDDPERALADACTRAHRACFRAPVRTPQADLGLLAVASPYASYLRSTGDTSFQWDLAHLREYAVHPGLVPLGVVVDFTLDTATGRLTPIRIEHALGVDRPGTASWDCALRIAVCSITSDAAMIRHFNWLHLTAGPALEAATRNQLPALHPVRRLLWPHVFGTHSGNDLITEVLMSEGGEFDAIYSLSHRAKCKLFEATTGAFDLASINPVLDAARRGVGAVLSPARDNWTALYDVLLAHARRSLAISYPSVEQIADDRQLAAWIDALDRGLPHGVRTVMGSVGAAPTLDGVATLIATLIYLATVEHEITGSGLWDYQLWSDRSPVRIYENGQRVPVDVFQRLVNANLTLNVHRTMLLDDALPRMAIDDRGITAFVAFQQDLLRLQAQLDATAPAPWRVEPRHLKANINA